MVTSLLRKHVISDEKFLEDVHEMVLKKVNLANQKDLRKCVKASPMMSEGLITFTIDCPSSVRKKPTF
jgi:hypothetical protein